MKLAKVFALLVIWALVFVLIGALIVSSGGTGSRDHDPAPMIPVLDDAILRLQYIGAELDRRERSIAAENAVRYSTLTQED